MIKSLFARYRADRAVAAEARTRMKIYELRHHITKFFEELQVVNGSVEIPAWMECRTLMLKLGIVEDQPEVVEYYHRRLRSHSSLLAG